MQRIFDIIISMLLITLLAPILIFVCIVLKYTGEGKVFYLQSRVGFQKKTFKLIKFATMLENSPNIGTGTITIKDDPRVLPIGKFLRKSKINELPQLINVLWGDMSLIGPRPLTAENFRMYDETSQSMIASVRPGISGIGSIIFRDEEELLRGHDDPVEIYKTQIAPRKSQLENWYVSNNNLLLYIFLLFATIWVVLTSNISAIHKLLPDLPPSK